MNRNWWVVGAVAGLVVGAGAGLAVVDLDAVGESGVDETSLVASLDEATCGAEVADWAARLGVSGSPALTADRCEVQADAAGFSLERLTWVTGGAYPATGLEVQRTFALSCAELGRNGRRVAQPVPGTTDPGTCAAEDPSGAGLKEYVVSTRAEHVVVVRWITSSAPDGAARSELRGVLEQIATSL